MAVPSIQDSCKSTKKIQSFLRKDSISCGNGDVVEGVVRKGEVSGFDHRVEWPGRDLGHLGNRWWLGDCRNRDRFFDTDLKGNAEVGDLRSKGNQRWKRRREARKVNRLQVSTVFGSTERGKLNR